jgi:uncharacterized protein (UPF0332 family)
VIRPDDFLTQARAWVQGAVEADWRSAVSRAYYAAFHVARDLLSDLGFAVPRGPQAHSYLWLRLSNCGHPATADAGGDLNDLQRWRNRADYDITLAFSQGTARTWVRTAEQVIQCFLAASAPPRCALRSPRPCAITSATPSAPSPGGGRERRGRIATETR